MKYFSHDQARMRAGIRISMFAYRSRSLTRATAVKFQVAVTSPKKVIATLLTTSVLTGRIDLATNRLKAV